MMKTKVFRISGVIVCGIILGLACTGNVLSDDGVSIGYGTLKIGGIYQTTYTWYEDDNLASEFKIQRARLLLSGTLVPGKIAYFVQADATQNPYLLDSKLILNHIPNTEMSIGRFIPYFTLFMPRSAAQLDFIKYPLTTSHYAMWRQTGIQLRTTINAFSLYYGVFNGYQYDSDSLTLKPNDWGDQNDAKDFLLSTSYNITDKLKIGVYGWWGTPYNKAMDEDFTVTRYGANFEWRDPRFHLAAEYIMANDDFGHGQEVKSHATLVQGGFFITERWEILARYETWDPDRDITDNGDRWFTAGLNYLLEKYYTKFYLNYIAKMEEGNSVDNDEIVVQVQFSF